MAREYIQRKNPPVGRPTRRRNSPNRQKSGPPLFFLLVVVLVAIIVAVVLAVVLINRGGKEEEPSAPSSAVSAVSSQPEEIPSSQPASPAPVSSSGVSATETIPEGQLEKLDAFVKIGGTGYEYYTFSTETANQYITAVADAGNAFSGVSVYSMVIPGSMDIMLPESYLQEQEIPSKDQKKAIEYINSSINAMNPAVKTVPIFDALKSHCDEYLYFRTDRHWTQLGAYYAYVEFCKAKGIDAVPLDQFDKREYEGFLGSFYDAYASDEMAEAPDTVEAYHSKADTTLYYTTSEGVTGEQAVIADGSGYEPQWLYLIFSAGDQPYVEISNRDLDDGSACLVVKDSFGGVFAPYLANHYETVYVVDARYYDGSIPQLASEKGVSDVILLNSISFTTEESLISDFSSLF